MNGIRRTLSLRKRRPKSEATDGTKPQQWLDDESKIKEGCCSFQVKHLIVDQTIEKVSFCAPDRGHEKGFAYICRDGATRRWMCHAFLAVKESGERLSHAVGCAFAICLEKKQKRERDAVQSASTTVTSSDDRTFLRVGSFRPATLAQRMIDPQSTIVTEPLPLPSRSTASTHSALVPSTLSTVSLDYGSPQQLHVTETSASQLAGAISRPRPSSSIRGRQGSLRLFPKLNNTSPFKRDFSLRLEELPSNLQRLTRNMNGGAILEEEDEDERMRQAFSDHTKLPFSSTSPLVFGVVSATSSPLTAPSHNTQNAIQPSHSLPPSGISPPTTRSPLIHSSHDNSMLPVSASISDASPVPPMALFPMASSNGTGPPMHNFTDPFSAAPINPVTIQQHHSQQQQEQLQLQTVVSRVEPLEQALVQLAVSQKPMYANGGPTHPHEMPILSIPTSPFLGGPPIVAPPPPPPSDTTVTAIARPPPPQPPLVGASWRHGQFNSAGTHFSPQHWSVGFGPSDMLSDAPNATGGGGSVSTIEAVGLGSGKQFGAFSTAGMNQTNQSTGRAWLGGTESLPWATPPLLPPEPNRCADPFDVEWAEQATAAYGLSPFATPAAVHRPGNPFLSTDATGDMSPNFQTNGTASPSTSLLF